jgi:hypothetical protein
MVRISKKKKKIHHWVKGKASNQFGLEIEPVDEALKLRAESAEKAAKELEERVIRKRSSIPAQITPLMQDAIRRQSTLADRIIFEDGQETPDDTSKLKGDFNVDHEDGCVMD